MWGRLHPPPHQFLMQEDRIRTSQTYLDGYKYGTPEYFRDHSLRKRYGISSVEWDALFETQDCACALCGRTQANRWHTDHDHATGTVRGILCWGCNSSLGHLGDSVAGLEKAIAYLRRADARIQVEPGN